MERWRWWKEMRYPDCASDLFTRVCGQIIVFLSHRLRGAGQFYLVLAVGLP